MSPNMIHLPYVTKYYESSKFSSKFKCIQILKIQELILNPHNDGLLNCYLLLLIHCAFVSIPFKIVKSLYLFQYQYSINVRILQILYTI